MPPGSNGADDATENLRFTGAGRARFGFKQLSKAAALNSLTTTAFRACDCTRATKSKNVAAP
jgi:hypothetical protein